MLPVAAFFVYIFYLSYSFHDRDHMNLDYAFFYDNLWYFHDRLKQGSFALWNPFNILGKQAVYGNAISVSIFTPLLHFIGVTLSSFHFIHIAGTFLALTSVYVAARVLGYDRYYSFLPMIVLLTGGYRYYISYDHLATFLFLYPIAIAALLRFMLHDDNIVKLDRYLAVSLLLSLAFLGLRVELQVYAYVFIFIVFAVYGLYSPVGRLSQGKAWVKYALFCSGVIITVLLANVFQLPLLANSMRENSRISGAIGYHILLDRMYIRYLIVSVINQPCLVASVVFFLMSRKITTDRFSGRTVFVASMIAGLAFVLILAYKTSMGSLMSVAYKSTGVCVVIAMVSSSIKRSLSPAVALLYSAVSFLGLYVTDYSAEHWIVNRDAHNFFMNPFLAGFMVLGSLNLYLKSRTWLLIVLAAFHFVGESVVFLSYYLLGIPWLASRASIMELPVQTVIIMESFLFCVRMAGNAPDLLMNFRVFARATKGRSVAVLLSIKRNTARMAGFACIVMAFLLIKPVLIPFDGNAQKYVKCFPFSENPSFVINEWQNEAVRVSQEIRGSRTGVNPLKRVRIEDDVLSFAVDRMAYRYLPTYSKVLNTAPIWTSEFPVSFMEIMNASSAVPDRIKGFTLPHAELSPLVQDFFYKYWTARGMKGKDFMSLNTYLDDVLILPHKNDDIVLREIMAEEGSQTNRAFVSDRVVVLGNQRDEYAYLKDHLEAGGRLQEWITTSDHAFRGDFGEDIHKNLPLRSETIFEEDSPERVVIRAKTNKESFLALMDTFSSGWKAHVNGVEARVYRGYLGTRFVHLQPGTSTVVFEYSLAGLRTCMIASLCVWILLIILGIVRVVRGRLSRRCARLAAEDET